MSKAQRISPPPTAFRSSTKQPRQESTSHLDFIRSLPCVICGNPTATEAAHVRYAEPRAGKHNPGTGQKPADHFTVPLCGRHHREQHTNGERSWWTKQGIDPVYVAMALALCGSYEAGERIITNNRRS